MYAVIRRYKNPKLIGALEQRRAEVEAVIRPVPGFVAYYLIKSGDGGTSVTVCDDKAGTDASIQRAAEWIRSNLPDAAGAPPEVTEGNVIQEFTR
jgi:hypothetical protein